MLPKDKHYIRCLEALKEASLFKNLEIDQLHSILQKMNRDRWKSGVLTNSLEASSTLHFIVSGRLKVYQTNAKTGREYTIFILSKGDLFDIFSLLDTEVHNVNWETLDDLEILTLSKEEMQNFILKYRNLNQAVFKYLGKRMRMLEDVAVDTTIHNTLTRLCNLLLKNINGESNKLELINNLPHDEIASLIGTTRAVVNRYIQELKKKGAITVKRKQIDIKNIERLISIAEEKYVA